MWSSCIQQTLGTMFAHVVKYLCMVWNSRIPCTKYTHVFKVASRAAVHTAHRIPDFGRLTRESLIHCNVKAVDDQCSRAHTHTHTSHAVK